MFSQHEVIHMSKKTKDNAKKVIMTLTFLYSISLTVSCKL